MTKKFQQFKAELQSLCEKYEIEFDVTCGDYEIEAIDSKSPCVDIIDSTEQELKELPSEEKQC